MKRTYFLIFIQIIVLTSCTVSRRGATDKSDTINSLQFIGEYIVPFNHQFNGTTIGGLSGIDYDPKMKEYYLICDDRSQINPARFYTAKIDISQKGINNIEFINVTTFLQSNDSVYPDRKKDPANSPDPEAMRYDPVNDQFIWTNEGERIVGKDTILQEPSVILINKNGKYIYTFSLPSQMHIYAAEKGLRQNGVFEGLTFADNFNKMYVSIEEPLYEDGPRAALQDVNPYTRIIEYNFKSRMPAAQYAYHLETIAHPSIPANEFMVNGISEILAIGKDKLLVMERSFSTGKQACTIRVFITDISNASNITDVSSLKLHHAFKAASKKLLINMDDLGLYIDNMEGVTFGPDLPNGHKTLIFVSDNNFSKEQKTQFLLFQIN